MSLGRIPAQMGKACEAKPHLSSHNPSEQGEIITQRDDSQPPLAANYCNHVSSAPKLFVIPTTHKPRALIVQETLKKLGQAYNTPKQALKTLQFHDESGRQVRSQRREAAIAVLQVMCYYQDDATGRIGRQRGDGSFADLSLEKIAKYARIALRRAKRAIRDIVRSGYLAVVRQFVRDATTGQVKGKFSVRSFKPKFYTDLDVKGSIWQKWFSQRGWALKRQEKKELKQDRKKAQAMMGLIKEIAGSVGQKAKGVTHKVLGIVKSVPSVENEKRRQARIQHEQNLGRKAVELFNLDPSRSISEYLLALREAHPFK